MRQIVGLYVAGEECKIANANQTQYIVPAEPSLSSSQFAICSIMSFNSNLSLFTFHAFIPIAHWYKQNIITMDIQMFVSGILIFGFSSNINIIILNPEIIDPLIVQ